MKTYKNLYPQLCSYDNLFLAYKKARKRKTKKEYVIEFERNLNHNLSELRMELLFHSYRPQPLTNFIIYDPKTRKISKSSFRDRIVHPALCNILEPIFEKRFIYDSYANRKNKGTLAAIKRYDYFLRKVSCNYTKIHNSNRINGYIFKADIQKYFDNVNHKCLLQILQRIILDKK